MDETVSVMIVDDQRPFREAARAVLSRIAGFQLVAEVDSGEAAVRTSAEMRPDLVLMDINMGELDGIGATRAILDANPATKVILVSTYTVDELPAGARTSGAVAYVNKDELSPRGVRKLWEAGGDPVWLASVEYRNRQRCPFRRPGTPLAVLLVLKRAHGYSVVLAPCERRP